MAPPGVMFAFFLNAGLVLGLLLLYRYVRTTAIHEQISSNDRSVEQWYEEALSLLREIQRAVIRSEPLDQSDTIQRDLLPLSSRLQSHARTAPAGVDPELQGDLYNLGVDCYKVGMEHTTGQAASTGVLLEDKLDRLQTGAEDLEASIVAQL